MLYQKVLMSASPYRAKVGTLGVFCEHRHADIEINYCIEGSFDILVNKKKYVVNAGEYAIISPMVSHEIPAAASDGIKKRRVLTLILGSSFLKKYFDIFSKVSFTSPLCSLNIKNKKEKELKDLFEETAEIYSSNKPAKDLLITGNLYKICAYILSNLADDTKGESTKNDLRSVANIEKVLELIYYNYANQITLDDAAALTGYGKSNFCKIFKNIVGDTFHNTLNRQRIESSYTLLSQTNLSISDIAIQVGFSDSKTYCRVFKSVCGITPGTYRKNN